MQKQHNFFLIFSLVQHSLQWVKAKTGVWQQHKKEFVAEALFTSSWGGTFCFLKSSLDFPVSS